MKHFYTSLFVILLTTLSLLPAQARADVPEPLTITALKASTVKFFYSTAPSTNAHTKLSYRINDGEWTTLSANTDYNLSAGSVMYIRGMCTTGINNAAETSKRYHFRISGSVDLSGDLMSLINYTQQVTTIPCNYCFFWLFFSNAGSSLDATDSYNCISIHSAENLRLSATTLKQSCYEGLFRNCRNMVKGPDMSAATNIAQNAFLLAFRKCEKLTGVTSMPNENATLGVSAFQQMFLYCSSLVNAPALPYTNLGNFCYSNMFEECKALENAPSELPATTLADGCYKNMFKNCTALERAPVIKATTIPNISTDYYGSFAYMFNGCKSLNYVKVYFRDWNPYSEKEIQFPTYNWFQSPSSSGNFYCPCALSDAVATDIHHIPSGWTRKCFYIYTFDANSGTWDGTDNAAQKVERESDETLSALPEAQKTGYRFTGWNTKDDGTGDAITLDNQTDFTTDATFYAQFEKMPEFTFDVATTSGTWDGSDGANRVLYAELPSVTPQKEGNNFTGWNTATDGSGDAITADKISSFTADATFYAQWQPQLIELDDTQDNSALLASLNGVSCDVLLAGRTLVGGCANTLCLPFDLTEEQLATSPLSGCTIWEFGSSTFDGETLHIDANVATEIEAGKPYLVEPAAAVQNLRFEGVTISASTGTELGNNAVRFVGILSPFTMTAGSEDQLFVGAGNKLLRPSSTSALRGFRAWFRLNDGPAQAAPRAKLTFGEKPQVPTGLDNTEKDNSPRKIFINGQLYITHDGTTYTPAGNVMPK